MKLEDQTNVLEKEFFDFVYRRQLIWYKRFMLKQRPPWTKDEVLQTFKIINVYRELDRCTLYLINTLKGVRDREKLLLNIIFYRFFNVDNLYEKLGVASFSRINSEALIKKFDGIKKEGKPIFSNAYLISSGTKGKEKHIEIIEHLEKLNLQHLINAIDHAKTPEESFKVLLDIPLVGPFLACEIWTDLTYFNFFQQKWDDNDFVNIGPGAKWGLEIIYGEKLTKKELREKLEHLYEIQKNHLGDFWKKVAYKNAFSHYPYLSITNIEGALCEFRKYWRLKKGLGKRRYFNSKKL